MLAAAFVVGLCGLSTAQAAAAAVPDGYSDLVGPATVGELTFQPEAADDLRWLYRYSDTGQSIFLTFEGTPAVAQVQLVASSAVPGATMGAVFDALAAQYLPAGVRATPAGSLTWTGTAGDTVTRSLKELAHPTDCITAGEYSTPTEDGYLIVAVPDCAPDERGVVVIDSSSAHGTDPEHDIGFLPLLLVGPALGLR